MQRVTLNHCLVELRTSILPVPSYAPMPSRKTPKSNRGYWIGVLEEMSENFQWHCKTTYKSDSCHWFHYNHSLLHDITYNTWSLARAFVTAHTLENAPIQRWSRTASAILSHEATCSKRHCARPHIAGTHHSTAQVSTQVFTLFSSYGDNNRFKGKNKLY